MTSVPRYGDFIKAALTLASLSGAGTLAHTDTGTPWVNSLHARSQRFRRETTLVVTGNPHTQHEQIGRAPVEQVRSRRRQRGLDPWH